MLSALLGALSVLPPGIAGFILGGAVVTGLTSMFGMFAFYGVRLKRLPRLVRQLGGQNPATALNDLLKMGKRATPVLIEALSAPAMSMNGTGMEAWDGNLARRQAAEGLGRLKDAEAVPPLMATLGDASAPVREKVIWALAEIGDARAVPALIPLLGDAEPVRGSTISALAAEALRKLGEDELTTTFAQTLQGDRAAWENLRGEHRRAVAQALIKALQSHHSSEDVRVQAACALGELGAVEALPTLRLGLKLSLVGIVKERVKEACEQAIAKLEALTSLPRSSQAVLPDADVESLPRPVTTPQPDTETLPRPTDPQRTVN
jgi:HEAT repeat protein